MLNQRVSPELSLLIQATIGSSEASSGSAIDWQRLSKLAKWHQVRPLLFDYLEKHSQQIPEKNYHELKEFTFGQAVTNMAFLGISTRLLNELKGANISVFPMKGALWAWMLYKKPTLREFGDIDYFIDKSDVEKSLAVLRQCGFAPDSYRNYLFNAKNGAAAYFKTDYQLPLRPTGENTLQSLEIQWNCSYPRYYFDFSFAELMVNAIEFQIGNQLLKVPSPENQLIMMIIHHAGVEQWDKLKYASDFVRLLDLYAERLNWNYVRKQAASRGFEKLVVRSVQLAELLTGKNYIQYLQYKESDLPESDSFINEILAHWEKGRLSLETKSGSILNYNLRYRDNVQTKALICLKHLKYLVQWRLLWHKFRWYRQRKLRSAKV